MPVTRKAALRMALLGLMLGALPLVVIVMAEWVAIRRIEAAIAQKMGGRAVVGAIWPSGIGLSLRGSFVVADLKLEVPFGETMLSIAVPRTRIEAASFGSGFAELQMLLLERARITTTVRGRPLVLVFDSARMHRTEREVRFDGLGGSVLPPQLFGSSAPGGPPPLSGLALAATLREKSRLALHAVAPELELDITVDTGSAAMKQPAKVSGAAAAPLVAAKATLNRLPLAPLSALTSDLANLDGASANGRIEISAQAKSPEQAARTTDLAELRVEADLDLRNLGLDVASLAPRPISHLSFAIKGRGRVSFLTAEAHLEELVLRLGSLVLEGKVDMQRAPGASAGVSVSADVSIAKSSCQALLFSFPTDVIPHLQGAVLGGDFRARVAIRPPGQAGHRASDIDLDVAHDCTIKTDPPAADVHHLLADGKIGEHLPNPRWLPILDPQSPNWRSLDALPAHLWKAILASEDAGFFRHAGFEPLFIRQALAENFVSARVRRGASTISQQVIKNLYLDGSRSLSRKLEELVLTWRLEQVVSKRRILELYLNLVELGPAIYGVTDGARRYFDKDPSTLTPLESVYLALALPSPRSAWTRLHSDPLDADWQQKALDLLRAMKQSGALSPEAYAAAKKAASSGHSTVVPMKAAPPSSADDVSTPAR